MGHGRSVDCQIIVTKHRGGRVNTRAKVPKFVLEVNDLLRACAGGNAFQTKGSSLDGELKLQQCVNDRLVGTMNDASDRLPTDQVVTKVCVNNVCDCALTVTFHITHPHALLPLWQEEAHAVAKCKMIIEEPELTNRVD